MEIKQILLTTDFSECSEHAFASTADLARRLSATLDLVHVSDFPPPPGAEIIGIGVSEYNDRLQARLDDLARSKVFQGVTVRCRILEGQGVEALKLYQAERGHDLAAVATHGHSGMKHFLLGSFTEKVVRTLACPVLALRGQAENRAFQVRRILFPYDFSECSRAALGVVRFFASTFDAEVHLLYVLYKDLIPATSFPTEAGFVPDFARYWQQAEEASRKELQEFAAKELEGIKVSAQTTVGSALQEIVEQAASIRADLLIMATHGRKGLSHALVGSVAERVVRKAPCSTVTVRPPETA